MSSFNSRYHRQIILPEIGVSGQEKLDNSKVLVIGAGGLGCPILQYLTAAGIGSIGIIDFDVVESSNLHRQILYGASSLGINKAIAAKQRLTDLNPEITITAYPEKLTTKNACSLFSKYDIIVDGSDNFSTRYLVNDACILMNKPLVYGAIFKFEGQVAVFNYKNGPTYRCLFPEPPKAGSVPSCSDIGVLGVLPGIIGSMQANEVLKIVLDLGDILNGKLLQFDCLTMQSSAFKIHRSELQISKTKALQNDFETMNYDTFCGIIQVVEIDAEAAFSKNNVQYIDVREPHEHPKIEDLAPIYIPLGKLQEEVQNISKEKETILFCQSGIRSKKAAELLLDNGFNNIAHIKGGAIALSEYQAVKEV
ncbi:molybdopterin-synthase adenylyltransferase MoeB [Aquimarina sp. AD10]|uniref:molybdopterin-synthase adenylyltransferase MoeB n=1 Tax=Aquimarina sp. AD10 TaxID=1714849 RepID=UPI000E5237CB|nr:molybdopterin-synthase adenylyltransferase MoeB [Aquimarina sp. AD10]AXT62339.1 molybdopterin-synthase adenylyltransferase MoeB [Aquimarina sp. AD10]RKM90465.1 molybdopterin-synthase adenylyltransferase MoeB [Aquimarina sp. AD10]